MNLVLDRVQKEPGFTIGRLTVSGPTVPSEWSCWTCEDAVREGPKIPGETAIPAGHYNVRITYSPRFKRDLPLVMGVQGFEGIRIHPGNTASDTEGCILVGLDRFTDGVGQSRAAFAELFQMMQAAASAGEAIDLEIV